jgi:pimeloyl-ACP methyl ester carboxylesterase
MQMPLLYLYGTASDFMEPLLQENIRFLETHLPHAQIVGLMGGIHDLQFQKPAEVADIVLDFLGNQPDCISDTTSQRASDGGHSPAH